MAVPTGVQMRRVQGWRMPEGAVSVARPTRWGNPWKVGDPIEVLAGGEMLGPCAGLYSPSDVRGFQHRVRSITRVTPELAVAFYEHDLQSTLDGALEGDPADQEIIDALDLLRGHDLGCYCPLDQPCHRDVLLRLANR